MKWFDSRGKAIRMFLNEYGYELYNEWRRRKMPMRDFEREVRVRWGQAPSSPIMDEFEKEAAYDY